MQEAKYQQLAQQFRALIQSGQWATGMRIPTEDAMVAQYAVSKQTVRRAVTELVNEGLLLRRQGSGTYVRSARERSATHTVALVTTYVSDYILPSIIRGVEESAAEAGYRLELRSTGNRMDRERALLQELLEQPVDGLIIEGAKTALPNPNLGLYRQLRERGVPMVFLSGYYPELEDCVYVITDDFAGGQMAARCLLSHGHRRIGGLFKADDMQGHRRFAGVMEACREANLTISDDSLIWYTTESLPELLSAEGLRRVSKALRDCTAVVCYNDQIAAPLMRALLADGRTIPDDLAMISFDRSRYSDLAPVTLTSLAHPKEEIGRVAMRKLLRMLRGVHEKPEILPWTLQERASTAGSEHLFENP